MTKNTLRITGWRSAGLRCPETTVQLNQTDSRITFIQMPNGTGKTTTYNLIDFAFENREPEEIPDVRYDLTKPPITISKWISGLPRKFNPEDKGMFELYCEFDKKALIIHLDFDFQLNKVIKTYTFGGQTKFKFAGLNTKIKTLINSGITSFMMLDGERANAFLNESKEDASHAIANILQLDVLNETHFYVNYYFDEEMKKTTKKAARKQEVTKATKGLQKAEELWNKLKQDQNEIKPKIEAATKTLDGLEDTKDALGAGDSARSTQIQDLRDKIGEAKTSWHEEQNKQIPLMCEHVLAFNPNFGSELQLFRDNLEKNKLPESAGKEWFIELSEQTSCVCGRPIEATQKAHIQTYSSQYLSTNHQNILNNIKSKIREDIEPHSGNFDVKSDELQALVGSSSTHYQEMRAKMQGLEELTEEIAKETGREEELASLVTGIVQLEIDIENLELEKANLNGGAGNPLSVAYVKVQFDTAKENLKQYTEAYLLVTREAKIHEMIEAIYTNVRTTICEKLTEETNIVCRDILGNDDMEIESIGKCLILKDSQTKETGGSVGQTMVLAYSFIQVLNEQTGVQIPLILDSPVGPLDDENRKEIANLLWGLGERNIIIFIINTEKQDFVTQIQDNAQSEGKESEVHYITQFKRNAKTERFFGKGDGNGFISYETEFFADFSITDITDGDV